MKTVELHLGLYSEQAFSALSYARSYAYSHIERTWEICRGTLKRAYNGECLLTTESCYEDQYMKSVEDELRKLLVQDLVLWKEQVGDYYIAALDIVFQISKEETQFLAEYVSGLISSEDLKKTYSEDLINKMVGRPWDQIRIDLEKKRASNTVSESQYWEIRKSMQEFV